MIDILLPTYNSEKYLSEQLDSIISQDFTNWHLIINDDCSTDGTPAILDEYANNHSNCISFSISPENRGLKGNINTLLSKSAAKYIMLSDHDDVWLPNKISDTYACMRTLETEVGESIPLLVFTDKVVVNADLVELYKSHTSCEKLDVNNLTLNKLLVQNAISGCTVLFNRQLLELAYPIPQEAVMHDYWLALVASAFGRIIYLNKPTMLYRQHTSNGVGAVAHDFKYMIGKVFTREKKLSLRFAPNIAQGIALLDRCRSTLPDDTVHLLEKFASLEDASYFKFCNILIKNNFLKTGLIKKLGMLF